MSTTIDERVLEMRFDNSNFESNVNKSISTLGKLKKALKIDGAESGFENIAKAAGSIGLDVLDNKINKIKMSFSALQVMGVTALSNITNKVVDAGTNLIKSLSVDQIATGWDKYAQKTQAVQTILAADKTLDISKVNEQLEELNWFTDETSYDLLAMTQAIGKFMAAGTNLEPAMKQVMGYAAWAAQAGADVQGANIAMVQMQQAMGKGYVAAQDWQSLETQVMDTKEFKELAIEVAKTTGALDENGKTAKGLQVTYENFRTTLSEKWFTTDVLNKTVEKYGEFAHSLYELQTAEGVFVGETKNTSQILDDLRSLTAESSDQMIVSKGYTLEYADAIRKLAGEMDSVGGLGFQHAQEATTFAQAIKSVKDAVSTGWMQTFELIFGNYEEAKDLWTDLANSLYDIFVPSGDARNEILAAWKELEVGGRDYLIDSFSKVLEHVQEMLDLAKEGLKEVFGVIDAERLGELTHEFWLFTRTLEFSEEEAETFKGIFESIGNTIKFVWGQISKAAQAIKKGFEGMFPKLTLDRIKEIIDWFGKLIEKFKLSDTELENITRISKGFAAIIDIVQQVVGGLIDLLTPFGDKLTSGREKLLNFLGNIGDWLVKADEWVKSNETIYSTLESIRDWILGKIDTSKLEGVSGIFETIGDKLVAFHEWIKNNLTIQGIVDAVTGAFNALKDAITGVIESIKGSKSLEESGLGLSDFLEDFLKVGSVGGIIAAIGTLIENLLFNGRGIKAIFNLAKTFGEALTEFGDVLWSLELKLDVQAIKQIGVAILLITVSMLLLSSIPGDKLLDAVGALGTAMTILVAAFKEIKRTKMSNGFFSEFQMGLASLGIAILLFAAAMKILSTIDTEHMVTALVAMVSIVIMLTYAFRVIQESAGSLKPKGLLKIAVAVGILALCFKLLSSLSFDEMFSAVASLAAIMIGLVETFKYISMYSDKLSGKGIIKIAIAIGILTLCFKSLSKLNSDQVLNAAFALGLIMAELVIAFKYISQNSSMFAASGVMKLAIAIGILTICFNSLKDLTFEQATTAALSLMVIAAILVGSMRFLSDNVKHIKTRGLIKLALAIGILTLCFKALRDSTPEQAITAALSLMAIAAILVGTMVYLSENTGEIKAGKILLVSIALGILSLCFKMLSKMKPEEAWVGVGSLFSIAVILVLTMKLLSDSAGSIKVGQIIILTIVIAILALCIKSLSSIPWQQAVVAVGSLIVMLFALVGALAILQLIGPSSALAIPAIAALTILLLGVSFAIKLLADVPAENAKVAVEALIVMLAALIIALAILQGIGPTAALALPAVAAILVLLLGVGIVIGALCQIPGIEQALSISTALALLFSSLTLTIGVLGMVPATAGLTAALNIAEFIAVFGAVVVGLGALAQSPEIMSLLNGGIKVLEKIGEAIGSFIGGIVSGVAKSSSNGLKTVGENLNNFATNISSFADTMNKKNFDTIKTKATSIKDAIKELSNAKGDAEKANGAADEFKSIADKISSIDSSINSKAVALSNAIKSLSSIDTSGLSSVVDSIKTFANDLNSLGALNFSAVTDSFQNVGQNIASAISIGIEGYDPSANVNNFITKINNGLESGLKPVGTASQKIVNKIKSTFNRLSSSGSKIGRDLINGLISGMNNQSGPLYATAMRIVNEAIQKMKDTADSHSPSRKTMELGKYLDEGLIVGMKALQSNVARESGKVAGSSVDAFGEAISKIAEAVDTDLDYNPTITPVLDLSQIQNGVGLLNGMFGNPGLSVAGTANLVKQVGLSMPASNSRSYSSSSVNNLYIDGIKYNSDEYVDKSINDFVVSMIRKAST